MQAAIKLTRYAAPDNALPGRQHAWPLVVSAAGSGISSDIFVYQLGKAGSEGSEDQFSCVASVNQLFEIPALRTMTLNSELQIPWYRSSQLHLVCRSPKEANDIWNTLQLEVGILLDNFNLSNSLRGIVTAEISGAASIEQVPIMNPPIRIQLSYEPSGTPTYVSGIQDVASPNLGRAGWLPVISAPEGWTVPPGAKFFYNIDRDAELSAVWPLSSPVDGNLLFRDGVLLPYGVTHVFDRHTIWWLSFTPIMVAGYAPTGSALNGNAPWPTDYIGQSEIGAVSPIITIEVFK